MIAFISSVSPVLRHSWQYSRFAYERLYKDVFSVLDQIPAEYVEKFTQILKLCAEENISTADNQAVLIKVE